MLRIEIVIARMSAQPLHGPSPVEHRDGVVDPGSQPIVRAGEGDAARRQQGREAWRTGMLVSSDERSAVEEDQDRSGMIGAGRQVKVEDLLAIRAVGEVRQV